jgi:hypothetical protein
MNKTSTLIFSILIILLFAGCSKNSENKPITQDHADLLIGKWQYKSDEVKFYSKGQQTGPGPYTYTGGDYIQFNADGTGRNNETTFTYKVVDEILMVNFSAYTSGGTAYDASSENSHINELSD